MNALAWSLLHFIWQGAAIAALAAALIHVFKSPSTRYLVGVGALALMLLTFALTYAALAGSAGGGAEESAATLPVHVAANTWIADDSAPLSTIALVSNAGADGFVWVARAWLAGVVVLALRILFGLLVLEQLRRSGLTELPAELVARFRVLQARIGIDRLVRYCECQAVRVPAVIGLFRPVVLIPMRALTGLSAEQLEAVVAHELGHVKRFDVAVNLLQAIAETLLFFHPAVWWLNKRIRADREDCCDDIAVSVTGRGPGYARALATMAEWRDAPEFAMAATGGPIAARVARLLGVRRHGAEARTAGAVAASLSLAVALVAGGVSLGWVKPARAESPVQVDVAVERADPRIEPEVEPTPDVRVDVNSMSPPAPVSPVSPVSAVSPESPASPPSPPARVSPPASAKPARPAAPAAVARPARPALPAAPAAPARPATPAAAARPAGPAAPAGSTDSYLAQMQDAGYDGIDVDQLVAMKVQGVSPDYVRGMRSLGFEPDANDIVAMKVQDITPEYVRQIRELGFEPDVHDIIAMKVQGITPDYVREMRAQGFDVDANDLIAMKVQDVTPEYRRQLESAGYKLDANELVQAKVMGITPEFVSQAASHGFKNLSIQKLIQLKNADVF